MTDDLPDLGTALHDRVRDEHPDLDQLIRVSTRTGTRMRRRRTTLAAVGGALGVAAVVGIVGASLGGGGGTPSTEPAVATQPTVSTHSTPPDTTVLPVEHLPVRVAPSLQGWKVGAAADEKFPASTGRYFITVNVRPTSELASWQGNDPDHPADQVAHVGDNYFVTVQPARDVPEAVVEELVGALRYQPRWQK